MTRPWGMAKPAFDAYIAACFAAKVSPDRVVQTIGDAKASAGTHAKDGTLHGEAYCAAVDLSVRRMSKDQIRTLLEKLADNGFVAWYRYRLSFIGNKHIHAIYVGLPMKESLRRQVKDYLNGRDGLACHLLEQFWTAPDSTDRKLAKTFALSNPEYGQQVLPL